MGVMIYLATKGKDGRGPASPVDGDPTVEWPLRNWAKIMPPFAAHGGTVAVLPPLCKGSSLGAGFDPFDHYDWGSKNQRGRRETRYGSIEDAMRFIAICRANGMQAYVNVVHHHVGGDNGDQVYRYLGADGKTLNGRFPKDRQCFAQQYPNPDQVADNDWDLAYGREFMWNLGKYGDGKGRNGPGYVRRNLAEALDMQMRALGIEGLFIDDAKGTSKKYMRYLLTHPGIQGHVAFAEYSSGNTGVLLNWMNDTDQLCGVMDFALKYKLNNVLNHPGDADMRQLLSEGVVWHNPAKAVTFLDNFDSDYSAPVIMNQLLGHAMLLTWPGYPMLHGHSLYAPPDGYGLMDRTMNLVWIHETLAKGDLVWRWLDYNFLVYERMGDHTSSGLLAAVNNRPGSYHNSADWRPVTVQTKWRNAHLHDYTGNSVDQWTDAMGNVTIWLPPNEGGRGYVVFAPAGIENDTSLIQRRATNVFFLSGDLALPAARNGTMHLGRITAAEGSPITSRAFTYERIPGATIKTLFVRDGKPLVGYVPADGDYDVHIVCEGFPDGGAKAEVEIDYLAPRRPVID